MYNQLPKTINFLKIALTVCAFSVLTACDVDDMSASIATDVSNVDDISFLGDFCLEGSTIRYQGDQVTESTVTDPTGSITTKTDTTIDTIVEYIEGGIQRTTGIVTINSITQDGANLPIPNPTSDINEDSIFISICNGEEQGNVQITETRDGIIYIYELVFITESTGTFDYSANGTTPEGVTIDGSGSGTFTIL